LYLGESADESGERESGGSDFCASSKNRHGLQLTGGDEGGYFALETLPSDKCFEAYGSAEWQPKEDWDYAMGYGISEPQRRLLDFLITELGLSPWKI
jgi:hypothetical protein